MAPLASLAIISGMLSILSGLVGVMPLTVFFNHGGWLTVAVMEHLTTTLVRVPVLFTQRIFIFPWVAICDSFCFILIANALALGGTLTVSLHLCVAVCFLRHYGFVRFKISFILKM